jgi:AbrB family looped-hinge helix DNA binding protein
MPTVQLSSKGQIVLPAEIRRRYMIDRGARLEVIDSGRGVIVLVPLPPDPLAALTGMLAGGPSTQALLDEARQLDDRREAGRP